MALTITNAVRKNGATCDHLVITVSHEGVTRTFETTFAEIDALPMTPDDLKDFLMRWAKYRRANGRPILLTVIA